MEQVGVVYNEFMEDARALKNGGWSDYPVFQERCRHYLESVVGKVSQDQFEVMFNYAWQEGHSNGYSEVAMIFDDILDIVEKFTNVKT